MSESIAAICEVTADIEPDVRAGTVGAALPA